jgi:hypothetical protein
MSKYRSFLNISLFLINLFLPAPGALLAKILTLEKSIAKIDRGKHVNVDLMSNEGWQCRFDYSVIRNSYTQRRDLKYQDQ